MTALAKSAPERTASVWRSRPGAPTAWPRPAALFAVLLALSLRVHELGAQSFWYDEGTTATVAPRGLTTIVANAAADIHPPLYYLLVHWWVAAAGSGEIVLRFPSAALGVLSVALAYRLGRDAVGAAAGVAAAVLLATAPLPIWYSQEARMYALATALGLAATAVLLRALVRPTTTTWAAYGVLIAATLYTHYFAAAVPLAHAVGVALTSRRGRRPFLLAAGAGGALFLPWVARTYTQLTGWPATTAPFGPTELVARTLGLFVRGQGGDRADLLVALPLLMAGTLGAFVLARNATSRWLLLTYALVPLAAMFAVSVRRPFFHPKFVLLVAPAIDLLAGIGIAAVAVHAARRARPAGVTLFCLLLLGLVAWRWPGVAAQWSDPHLARDDYRGLAADVSRDARPGDAVVLDAPGQVEIFDYYFKGDLPRFPLPAERPIDEAATGRALEAIGETQSRVWLVLWAVPESDPTGFVERWLDERMYKATNRWYGGVRLVLYVNPALASLPTTSFAPNARFGDVAELRAAEVVALQLRPGDVVPVTLRWRALRSIDTRYTVFVHLIDGADYLWGQRDSEPAGGQRPTSGWRPGEEVVDRAGVPVLPGTPPGHYQLEIGLYDAQTGRRLPVSGPDGQSLGDRLLIGPIAVQPGRVGAAAKPRNPLAVWVAGERLLGYDLHPLGRDEVPAEVGRGDIALLTLYWRAGERPSHVPRRIALRLAAPGGAPVQRALDFTLGRYPVDLWAPGELVRDPYRLSTDDLAPGRYRLSLQLRDERDRPLGGYTSLGDLVVR